MPSSSTLTKKFKQILSAVHMVYRLVNSTYNVQELILRLTRLLCQFINATSSSVYILDSKSKRVVMKAIFDNKINILLKKKKDFDSIPADEDRVLRGYALFDKHVIGFPLVADDIVGAIIVRRKKGAAPFTVFDKDMLSVIAEQSVTAIRNLQLSEEQQKIILGSINFIGRLLKRHGHDSAVSQTSSYFKVVKALAERLGMGQEGINNLFYATILRESGAIDIPFDILSKKSQLTPHEFKIIREHPARNAELIRPVQFLKPLLPIILYHHENYDGTGYPSGIKKEQIPLGARIMAVVDAYDAMTKWRPYKKKLTSREAIAELSRNSGTQFDPRVVEAFVGLTKQKKFRIHLRFYN